PASVTAGRRACPSCGWKPPRSRQRRIRPTCPAWARSRLGWARRRLRRWTCWCGHCHLWAPPRRHRGKTAGLTAPGGESDFAGNGELALAGNLSLKQLERQCDLVAAKVERRVVRVEKAKTTLREARAELARLRAEQKETRTRLAEARKAGGGKAG